MVYLCHLLARKGGVRSTKGFDSMQNSLAFPLRKKDDILQENYKKKCFTDKQTTE